jgi:hypothetical protein
MAKITPAQWDEIRKKFSASIMADTSLVSLSQNLEGTEWPHSGEDEKPSKYINFSWDELMLMPEIAGKEDRAQLLASILKETLAFDDPFGDMAAQVEQAAANENPILKNVARFNIPSDYPLELINVSEGTRAVCASEGVKTLGDFANLGQQMSTRVVLGGDFRTMLNVLSHGDEEGMSQFIPFRKGHTGLHLPDALGLAVAVLPRPEILGLAKSYGAKLNAADSAAAKQLSPDQIAKAEAKVRAGLEATFKYFKSGKDDITKFLTDGGTLERYLVPLNDPAREAVAARLLAPLFKGVGKAAASESAGGDKKGLFSRLFGKG